MKPISNTVIAVMLGIALVTTIMGSVLTLTKFSQLGWTFSELTGAPSFSFGQTNLTISAVTSLSLSGANGTVLNFGSGYVNASCNACIMDSNNINLSMYSNA